MEDYSLRILLVDDDEDDYIITEDLLSEIEGRQFELDWHDNYDDALVEMKRNQHDICLIDYRLGRENGLRLLREAIDQGCRAPIILMTGQGDRAVDLEAMQAGAADYLVKGQVDAMSLERTLRYTYEHHRLLEKTQRQLHELTILHAVTNAAAETNDEDLLIEKVTKIIGEAFQADNFGFLLLSNLNHVLSPHASYQTDLNAEQPLKSISVGEGLVGLVASTGQPQRVAKKVGDENHLNVKTQLCVPIRVNNGVIGVIDVQSDRQDPFTEDDERLLTIIASQLATAIQKVRLFATTASALVREQRLTEIAHAISSALDLSVILPNVVRLAAELVGAQAGVLSLLSADKEVLSASYLFNLPQKYVNTTRPKGEGVSWEILENGSPLILSDYASYPRARSQWVEAGAKAYLGVPVIAGEYSLGVLSLFTLNTEDYFTTRDLTLIEAIGRQSGVAIQNAQLYADSENRADELALALAKQEELDRLKSEFIQNVSHELRTPLAIIHGYVELLDNGELGELAPEQERPISIIARRVRMLKSLVDDLITILKGEEHKIKWEQFSLVNLIDTLLSDFKVSTKQAGLTLEAEISADVPSIEGDEAQLRQVLDNLLSNALKFTPKGGKITVRLWQEHNSLMVQVADTGIGIEANPLERIFERFYQVDGSSTRRYGGTGLGLALVKEIVEAHGGRASVKSKVDKGSTFYISLPLQHTPSIINEP